ncbi:hypothetical protein VNO80_33808 [Phaseolus coccineus]|uniref:Uncharacterized protein n=1 Tax=Phaseolus coccineus TaxID=3886 RepID=A0AAN9L0X4_PHACN
MSLPAPPWPYAFWPARLDLALTGLPPSCKDSTPPLDALRPRFVQAALLGYALSRDEDKERGKAKYEQGSGWSLTRAIQETIQSKASKKKQKDSQSSRDSSRRQVLQRKLSIQREDRTLPIVRLVDEIGVPGEEEEKEDLNRKLIEKKAFPLSCPAKFELRSHSFRLACLFETLDLLSNPHAMIGKMDLNSKKTLEQRKGFSQGRCAIVRLDSISAPLSGFHEERWKASLCQRCSCTLEIGLLFIGLLALIRHILRQKRKDLPLGHTQKPESELVASPRSKQALRPLKAKARKERLIAKNPVIELALAAPCSRISSLKQENSVGSQFLLFDMPLPGKCYLLVFPEETIGPSIPYGNRNKRRTKPYIAVFRVSGEVPYKASPVPLFSQCQCLGIGYSEITFQLVSLLCMKARRSFSLIPRRRELTQATPISIQLHTVGVRGEQLLRSQIFLSKESPFHTDTIMNNSFTLLWLDGSHSIPQALFLWLSILDSEQVLEDLSWNTPDWIPSSILYPISMRALKSGRGLVVIWDALFLHLVMYSGKVSLGCSLVLSKERNHLKAAPPGGNDKESSSGLCLFFFKVGDQSGRRSPPSVHVSVACSLVAVLAASPTAFPSSWPIGFHFPNLWNPSPLLWTSTTSLEKGQLFSKLRDTKQKDVQAKTLGSTTGLSLAIGFVVRMAFLTIEGTPSVGNNMMPPAGGEGGSGEQESSWSGSWIERWLYPEGTSSDPNQGPPTVAQDREEHLPKTPQEVMGPHAPNIDFLTRKISSVLRGCQRVAVRTDSLGRILDDLHLLDASPQKRLKIMEVLREIESSREIFLENPHHIKAAHYLMVSVHDWERGQRHSRLEEFRV